MLTFDFTGLYENEEFDFYKETTPRSLFASKYISLKDISGTNCICDDYAKEEIKRKIQEVLAGEYVDESNSDVAEDCVIDSNSDAAVDVLGKPRISFFDNGNYHYMSRILMEILVDDIKAGRVVRESGDAKIECLFDLIVFDHHPDMKWTSYGDILSCGCWVLSALKDIPGLKDVYIIGADKALMEEAFIDNPEVIDRVHYFGDFISFRESLENGRIIFSEDIYISVDKDVVSKDELFTNWDQGDMSIDELLSGLDFLNDSYFGKILAVDVCGECTPDSEDAFLPNGFKTSNRLNNKIISAFLKTL